MKRVFSDQQKNLILIQVCCIFIIPILLIYFHIINPSWRMFVISSACLLMYGMVRKEKWTHEMLGLSHKTAKKHLIAYLVFTLFASFGIIFFADKLHMEVQSNWWMKPHFWFLFLFVSFLQEFAYRTFLLNLLHRVFKDRLGIVLINALLFTMLHIIYPIPQIMLPLAFIGGLLFAVMYEKYPSLILITGAHAILNFIAVLLGFFVIH